MVPSIQIAATAAQERVAIIVSIRYWHQFFYNVREESSSHS